jgi:hypothetical protein
MVKSVWERPPVGRTPSERWNSKIRSMRKHLSGWARHTTGFLKKEKLRLSSIIDNLEAIAEVCPILSHEIELKSQSNAEIARLLREEMKSNGIKGLKVNSFWKVTQTQDTFIVLPMVDTERNLFIHWSKMRGLLKAMKILSLTLQIILKVCLDLQRKATSIWMSPE